MRKVFRSFLINSLFFTLFNFDGLSSEYVIGFGSCLHQDYPQPIWEQVKKQSPSAGEIISDYIPEDIAILYERSGIGALSILTESKYFLGNIDHLSLVKKKTNLPILRKDFIIDKYQILESKIYQADCILLILSILISILFSMLFILN